MSEPVAALAAQTREWFDRGRADGWLTDRDVGRFESIEQRTPGDLFADAPTRPLVVAFFGGTGVGKSSLLNRLAGQAIARTGVERPTSREVTIYAHEAVELATLPPELPVADRPEAGPTVRVERHGVDDRRGVLWIDAPDIDSTHEHNRRLALAWLPHVDLLVYVVSPERYRDDVGWRVLRARGHRHGWMFVLNRWDEGDATQKEDFARILRQAGFDDPLLLCTCCLQPASALPSADEFDQIEAAIQALLATHSVRELERLGQRARLLEMRDALNAARQLFGDDERWRQVNANWQRHWQRSRVALLEGAEWPIRAVASRFAIRERALLGQVVRQAATLAKAGSDRARGPAAGSEAAAGSAPRDEEAFDASILAPMLWDDWAQDKLREALDAAEVEIRRLGIAAGPVRGWLDATAEQAGDVVLEPMRNWLRLALARPGSRPQRALRRVTGFLTVALPFLALLWVTVNVVEGYRAASRGAADYLGTDFAVHSVLLVLTAWALPFVCDRLLRPSLERTALRAMRRGLAEGLDGLDERLRGALGQAARRAATYRDRADKLFGDISRLALRPVEAGQAPLSRLLATSIRAATSSGSALGCQQPAPTVG